MNRAGRRFTGEEELRDAGLQLTGATMFKFWRWAFSDLRQNDVRGVFSEWMVAKLLDIDPGCRESWAAWDLVTPEGVRIEVKCAAHVQAWHETDRPSRIVWSGLKGPMDARAFREAARSAIAEIARS